ncbi:hypothetical protein HanRHA438_Chr09g0411281 [Helianthus annuus]|nr:hypothetical protein HanIR_Chr09g0430371 [Helianthus annuus]KAJ0889286.1 hypothetical protein HanRHA438_Chr09g0411281 [Helianthus annuus]
MIFRKLVLQNKALFECGSFFSDLGNMSWTGVGVTNKISRDKWVVDFLGIVKVMVIFLVIKERL